jgi:hypothetical protein
VVVDLDERDAGVLLVVGAQAAIERATVFDFGGKLKRERAGLVVRLNASVQFRVAKGEGFKHTMLRATLAEEHFVITQKNMSVNHPLAGGAQAPGEFPENFGAVGFLNSGVGHDESLSKSIQWDEERRIE